MPVFALRTLELEIGTRLAAMLRRAGLRRIDLIFADYKPETTESSRISVDDYDYLY